MCSLDTVKHYLSFQYTQLPFSLISITAIRTQHTQHAYTHVYSFFLYPALSFILTITRSYTYRLTDWHPHPLCFLFSSWSPRLKAKRSSFVSHPAKLMCCCWSAFILSVPTFYASVVRLCMWMHIFSFLLYYSYSVWFRIVFISNVQKIPRIQRHGGDTGLLGRRTSCDHAYHPRHRHS